MIAFKRIDQTRWKSQPQAKSGGCGCGGGGNSRSTIVVGFPTRTFINTSATKVFIATPNRTFAVNPNSVAINIPEYAVAAFTANPNMALFTQAYQPNESYVGYTL